MSSAPSEYEIVGVCDTDTDDADTDFIHVVAVSGESWQKTRMRYDDLKKVLQFSAEVSVDRDQVEDLCPFNVRGYVNDGILRIDDKQ